MPKPNEAATIFDPGSKPGEYGYAPHKLALQQARKKQIAANTASDTNEFFHKTGLELPQFWPLDINGRPKTHVYRLLDDLYGTDTRHPPDMTTAMRDKLVEGRLVDFSDRMVKMQALRHVSKESEGNVGDRPFLSCGWCLGEIVAFGSSSMTHHQKKRLPGNKIEQYCRIDMIALWQKGLLTETSFADLSDEGKFQKFFKPINCLEVLPTVQFGSCISASSRLQEVLLGLRGLIIIVIVNVNVNIIIIVIISKGEFPRGSSSPPSPPISIYVRTYVRTYVHRPLLHAPGLDHLTSSHSP